MDEELTCGDLEALLGLEEEPDELDLEDDLDDLDDLDEDFEAIYLKYEFDGVTTLDGLASSLRALAAECELKSAAGWALAAPVDGGWCHLRPGAPG